MTGRFALPGGAWVDGELVTVAVVRSLDGADEQWLAECAPELPIADVVTGLLERVVAGLGDDVAMRGLLVGDRDFLLLAARRMTIGEHFDATLDCRACGEPMDVSFDSGDIPIKRQPEPHSSYVATLSDAAGGELPVTFRLPTGADQEALAWVEPDRWEHELARRCVVGGDGVTLDDTAVAALAGAMQEAAPAVELPMDLDCPSCGAHFAEDFDLAPLVLDELFTSETRLLREVHALAYHYRWSETEILRLPRPRRQAFVTLIEEEQGHEGAR